MVANRSPNFSVIPGNIELSVNSEMIITGPLLPFVFVKLIYLFVFVAVMSIINF